MMIALGDDEAARISEGARQAGRSVDELEIWCMANVVPAATEAEGIDQVRSVLAGTANHVFRFTLDGKGLPEELIPKVQELKQRYDSSHHASPETAAAFLGAWKAGAILLSLSVLYGDEGIRHRLDDSGAKLLVTDPANACRFEGRDLRQ